MELLSCRGFSLCLSLAFSFRFASTLASTRASCLNLRLLGFLILLTFEFAFLSTLFDSFNHLADNEFYGFSGIIVCRDEEVNTLRVRVCINDSEYRDVAVYVAADDNAGDSGQVFCGLAVFGSGPAVDGSDADNGVLSW